MNAGRRPEFSRLETALLRRGEPDFVPLMEFYIHPDVKDEFLKRRHFQAPADEVGRKNGGAGSLLLVQCGLRLRADTDQPAPPPGGYRGNRPGPGPGEPLP